MLLVVAVGLILLWVIGRLTSYTMGGFINVLPAVAIAVIVVLAFQSGRVF